MPSPVGNYLIVKSPTKEIVIEFGLGPVLPEPEWSRAICHRPSKAAYRTVVPNLLRLAVCSLWRKDIAKLYECSGGEKVSHPKSVSLKTRHAVDVRSYICSYSQVPDGTGVSPSAPTWYSNVPDERTGLRNIDIVSEIRSRKTHDRRIESASKSCWLPVAYFKRFSQ